MHQKKPVTMRLDPDLLAAARRHAAAENRSLTNFVETVLMERLAARPTATDAVAR